MFKKIMNKKLLKNQKGLTLIELLAVIVILAIIAVIAIPAIGNIINNSKDKAILSDAAGLLSGAKIAIADGSCGAADDNNVITCNKDVLEEVYEGELYTGDQVTYNTKNKAYEIKFNALVNIKNKDKFKFGAFAPPATTISGKDLVGAMNK